MLESALNPKAIVVVGASDNPHKIGGRPLLYLSRFGYKGRVYPVNPHRRSVQGQPAFPDVASVPEAPDLAIIATPGVMASEAVRNCAARGVRTAVVMAAGFGETGDVGAAAEERRMVACARAAGMRIVGPNSQGLANFGSGAVASFSTMFLEVEPKDGPVAIVSQSGMMSVAPYGLLRGKGIGVRHAHATGNDSDVSLPELVLAVVHDPGVRLLLLYIESIRDPAILAEAAVVARERDVPIVAIKAGRTARGQAAARSHTGALANEDRVVDAFFHEHGIWRARDVHELVGAAELYLKGWRPKGRRLAVVSNSGASCVMAADILQEVDLDFASLSTDTQAALATQLPSFATTTNPIDLTAALLTDSRLFGSVLSALSDDDGFDELLITLPVAGAGYDVSSYARAAAEFAVRTGTPTVVAALQEAVAAKFREMGVPTFANQTEAISVLAQLVHHVRLMHRPRAAASPGAVVELPEGRSRFLSEAQSLDILSAVGLPTVRYRLCRSDAEARAAFRQFDGPVVLKACSPQLPHKSDLNLVTLDVRAEDDVTLAFSWLEDRLRVQGIVADGIIVAPMKKGRREFVLGARVDPVFGPVLIIGDGGRYVEALDDIALLLPPVRAEDVREALSTLRIAPLLDGVRKEPPLDIEPLCSAAVSLGQLVTANAERIASIDLNPLIVGSRGEGITIVDALIERSVHDRSGVVNTSPDEAWTVARRR